MMSFASCTSCAIQNRTTSAAIAAIAQVTMVYMVSDTVFPESHMVTKPCSTDGRSDTVKLSHHGRHVVQAGRALWDTHSRLSRQRRQKAAEGCPVPVSMQSLVITPVTLTSQRRPLPGCSPALHVVACVTRRPPTRPAQTDDLLFTLVALNEGDTATLRTLARLMRAAALLFALTCAAACFNATFVFS